LVYFLRGKRFLASAGWPVAPADIVQIAHSVDLEHVAEHWQQNHVANEANNVLQKILGEI